MKLNPPKTITWIIAVVAGLLGIIGHLGGFLGGFAFWLVVIGFVLLALATYVKGL